MSIISAHKSLPLVSIGVPTYNRPERLATALAQLSAQTYPNIEIIISDNCSPGETTRCVVEERIAQDSRVRYFRQSVPLSGIDNFKFVFKQASGTYFMWATDDDERRSGFVERLVEILEADQACVLAYSDATLLLDGEVLQTLESQIDTSDQERMRRVRTVLLNQNYNNEICGLFRREVLSSYDFPKFYGSDHAILVHAAMHGSIRKASSNLFFLGLGGAGATPEGVCRALGLETTFVNRYFGTLAQAVGLYRWVSAKFALTCLEKFALGAVLLRRLFIVKIYRDELMNNFRQLARKLGNKGSRFIGSLPRRLAGRTAVVLDFFRVAASVHLNMRRTAPAMQVRERILLVSLEGMNHFVPVLWGVLSWGLRGYGYDIQAVSFSRAKRNNWLFRLFKIPVIYLDRLPDSVARSELEELRQMFLQTETLVDILSITWRGLPLGKYAVSTYCRAHLSGEVPLGNPKLLDDLSIIAQKIYGNYLKAKFLFSSHAIGKAFFTELNTDTYGGFYLAALESNIDIVRWASSNRDDSYILHHLGQDFHSWHHSSLAPSTWEQVRREPYDRDAELQDFFRRRYGGEWAVFARNYRGTKEASDLEIRHWLGLGDNEKVAIVFSHILYDTLYFYGDDLFSSYVEWLVETVRSACANPRLTWLIKVHPSNIWRGEKRQGEYEEEQLIERHIGKLPPHVRIIPPNTPFSPISWMKFADFGITVRGTSGLEMAAMGKRTITAGIGRYDHAGFTLDSDSADDYRALLASLPGIDPPSIDETALARQYMHAVFIRKAFKISALKTALATGKKDLTQYNDLLLLPSPELRGVNPVEWPEVKELAVWLEQRDKKDYLVEQR